MPSLRPSMLALVAAALATAPAAVLGAQSPAASTQPAAAAAPRAFTPDDILALKGVSDAQISPDGKWVAYVVSAADLKENAFDSNLWLVAAAGGEPVQLTRSVKADNTPRWSPDGKRLAFLSNREENRTQLWIINPFGGEPERLTESKTPVQSFQWSPDGKSIAYVAQQQPTPEDERRQKEKDDAQVVDRDFKYNRLWAIDVAAKKATEVVQGEFTVGDPQWSPDGRQIAYVTNPTPKADDGGLSDVWVADADGKNARKLVENEGPDFAPRWSPDGREIAFVTRQGKSTGIGQSYLAVVPAAGGAVRQVAREFLYSPGAPVWSADGRTLYFTATTRTTSQIHAVPAAGGAVRQLTTVRGVVSPISLARGAAQGAPAPQAAFTFSSVQRPAEVHVATLVGSFELERLTDHNAHVRALRLGTSEVVRWKGRDGMEIEGVVIYPPDYDRTKRYPLLVNVHGGPSGVWTEGFPGSWGNYAHIWAGNGWVTFLPNVRGSSGYGEKFLAANIRDWGKGDYQDIQTGIDHLIARGVVDSTRMGQTGWSYGGYMTAWTLTQTDRFKAVMVGAGLTNMFSMYSTNDLQRTLENYFGAEPWDDLDAYWQASAMAHIKKARTPTLILHGANDLRVPVGQAQELYMGLKKNEVPVELVFYPRAGHGLSEPRHQLDKMRRESAWFAEHVLGQKPALNAKPDVKVVP